MNIQRSTEIKVGIVSIVSIILLIIGLSLGKSCNVSVNNYILKFRFPNSNGILETAPVFINGVKHGSVLSVVNDKGSVLITANLDDIDELKSDATAKISILEITGGKKIEIYPGKSSEKLNINNEIRGYTAADIADLVYIAGDIGKDAKDLIKQLDSIALAASKIINNDKFISQVQNTMSNASIASNDLKNLLENNMNSLQTSITNLKSITTDLKSIIQKDDPKLDSMLLKINVTLADTKSLMNNANNAISNADSLITSFKEISESIKQNDGLVNKLIYDKEFSKSIDSTMINLRLLLNQIQQYGINANVRLGGRP